MPARASSPWGRNESILTNWAAWPILSRSKSFLVRIVSTTDLRLTRLQHVNDLMRRFGNELPAQSMGVFFYVGAPNGCRLSDILRHLDLAQSSISRCTDLMAM